MTECNYEELSHTAEIGLRVYADTPAALFACMANAMFALTGAQPGQRNIRRAITVAAPDSESLLVDWLNELLYWHEVTDEVYDQSEVTSWAPTRLEAVAVGGAPATPPQRSIKAVTYHGLRLAEEDGGWLAEVYFDV